MRFTRRALPGFLLAAALAGAAGADDWPRWRGLRGDGISRETGLLRGWTPPGPPVAWRRPLTGGYSAFSVVGRRAYTQTEDARHEAVLCLDAETGRTVWEYRYPCDYDDHPTLDQRFKDGPRATPVVEGQHVYAIGTAGMLSCLEATTGRLVWQRDLLRMAGRTCPEFGYTNSPLVVGSRLFVHPGGSRGNSIAALDRLTGRVLWQALDDPIGYATPIYIEWEATPQVVYFTGAGAVAVRPDDGRLLWRFPWKTDFDLNVATPIFHEGLLFLSSNYGRGCVLLRLRKDTPPAEVYRSSVMHNHFSTSVLLDGHLYGFSNDRLRCVELATGRMTWDQRGLGRGSPLIADGLLIALGDQGDLVLAEARPDRYVERGRVKALDGRPCWTGPVLSGGRLFLRSEREAICLDLRAPTAPRPEVPESGPAQP